MNKKSDDLLRGAAFHEAGHVVVAMNLGLAVGEVEISDDGSGRSQIAPPDHLPLVDQIALCVAGIEALCLCGTDKLKDFSKEFGDKANPNTSQAIANAIVHAMLWLKTASIDEIIKSLPPEY